MEELAQIAKQLVASGMGILAADESTGTIKKRFEKIGIEDTVENHRKYRELLFTAPEIEKYISGVILFEETLKQSSSYNKPFADVLAERGIIPGIKVDQGLVDAPGYPGEKVTNGIEGLHERLREYKALGAKFAKWRGVFVIGYGLPSDNAIDGNTELLAQYAKICQSEGIVPIVEPEVLMEGVHSLNDCEIATTRVLKKVFEKLSAKEVDFKGMLLKPNWVHSGLDSGAEPTSEDVARATLRVLTATVPDDVPGIVFLSGGDSPDNSTKHLAALNSLAQSQEWGVHFQLSFSFGRALQGEALEIWKGKDENAKAAQEMFVKRARLVSEARLGRAVSV